MLGVAIIASAMYIAAPDAPAAPSFEQAELESCQTGHSGRNHVECEERAKAACETSECKGKTVYCSFWRVDKYAATVGFDCARR
jgi:hypothetical protein